MAILKDTTINGTLHANKILENGLELALKSDLNTKANLNGGNTFNGNQTISNDLIVKGDFTVQGTTTTINTETLSTTDNMIELAKDRNGKPLTLDAGLEVINYDGNNKTVQLVFDGNGVAKVGNKDKLQPLATRDPENLMVGGKLVKWNSTDKKLQTVAYDITAEAKAGANIASSSQNPSVSAAFNDGKFTFTFDYLRGLQGPRGYGVKTIVYQSTDSNGGNVYKMKDSNGNLLENTFTAPKGNPGSNGTNAKITIIDLR